MRLGKLLVAYLAAFVGTAAFSQGYVLDAMPPAAFSISEARIESSSGFHEPVFLFAEFNEREEKLVFQTERMEYARTIVAKYYSPGGITAISLYRDPGRKTRLLRQAFASPGISPGDEAKSLRNLGPLEGESLLLTPSITRLAPFAFLALALLACAAANGYAQRDGTRRKTLILNLLTLFAIAGATTAVLLYSEQPKLEVLSPRRENANEPIRISIHSSGNRRVPLAWLEGFRAIRFDSIPVIILSRDRKHFLKGGTSVKAWARDE